MPTQSMSTQALPCKEHQYPLLMNNGKMNKPTDDKRKNQTNELMKYRLLELASICFLTKNNSTIARNQQL